MPIAANAVVHHSTSPKTRHPSHLYLVHPAPAPPCTTPKTAPGAANAPDGVTADYDDLDYLYWLAIAKKEMEPDNY